MEQQELDVRAHMIQARDLIAIGWCRHRYNTMQERGQGWVRCFCVSGAFIEVSDKYSLIHEFGYARLRENLHKNFVELGIQEDRDPSRANERYESLTIEWNDRAGRTIEQVLAMFDKVIAAMEVASA